jgi:hypothetical protein
MDSIYHYILSDTSWNDTTYVNYVIVVDSGAVFTIHTFVGFAPEAKIIVKPGSELVIDGGYLTKICPDLWGGIEVWGNPESCQLKENQGVVTVKNESIIEYADTAIFTGRIANYVIAGDYAGGIVSCENSTFRDNVYDVIFLPFYNYVPGQLMEYPNRSRFTKVEFLTTENLYLYTVPIAHIKMTEVYGIELSGCFFENSLISGNYPYFNRGIGIYSLDGNFFLKQYCNTPLINPCDSLTPCKFTTLEYGIKALYHLSRRTLNIQEVEFNSNIIGISLSGIENVTVLSNNFTCKKVNINANDDRFIGGLFMENCSGYQVEANDFHPPLFESDTIPGVRYGLGIKNSGPENNEIYRNEFTKLNIGIICIGENRGRESGLCLICNEMNTNKNDFIVEKENAPPLAIHQGIAYYQGNPNDTISITAPAGNTFTSFPQPADTVLNLNWNYFNTGENIWYVHHQKQPYPLTYPYDDNYTNSTIALDEQPILFNRSLACPSRIGGNNLKNLTDPRQDILEADNYLSLYKNQLATLVDGGNTEALNLDVITSQSDEAMEIRQQLLDDSPYLSDTILKQSIYKEDVLPNAMVRDIMEANPHAAKNESIISALDNRDEPIPII